MAGPSPDNALINAIGPLLTTVIGAAIGWLPGGLTGAIGQPLTVLLAAVGGISGLIFSLMYKRYLGVLGASAHDKNSTDRNVRAERQAYDALRRGLRGGNIAVRLYAEWLTKFLDAVDRFFGDAGMADRTLFPHAFGLKMQAPLWTSPAFDRCLLLALIYPLATIFMIWAVAGHVGPAEAALGLPDGLLGWRRAISIVTLGVSAFAAWQAARAYGWTRLRWLGAALPCVLIFVSTSRTGTILGIFVIAFVLAWAASGAFAFVIESEVKPDLIMLPSGNFPGTGAEAVAVPVGVAFFYAGNIFMLLFLPYSVASIFLIAASVGRLHRYQFMFLTLYVLGTILVCFVGADSLPDSVNWDVSGPLLLFLGLLTLINAPFDWFSLGLTRALLRRGLGLGGWWPYFLALVDALAAALIITVLAIAMVFGVQTFDHLAEHSGGTAARVLPLDKLFDGIAAHPEAPEYWWVYALLLSTMIPSLLNLMIGGASLLRGIRGLPTLLLHFIPVSKAVPAFDRCWLALVLTCQVFVGAFLGIAAQFALAIGVIFYVLPWMGLELLDTARAVAEFDLPMRVLRLWWGDQP